MWESFDLSKTSKQYWSTSRFSAALFKPQIMPVLEYLVTLKAYRVVQVLIITCRILFSLKLLDVLGRFDVDPAITRQFLKYLFFKNYGTYSVSEIGILMCLHTNVQLCAVYNRFTERTEQKCIYFMQKIHRTYVTGLILQSLFLTVSHWGHYESCFE